MRSPAEIWREAEDVRAALPQMVDDTSVEAYASRSHILRNLYKKIILLDLDYALDKKIEQELWNTCFKTPITKVQPGRKDLKTIKSESAPFLNWFLESAAGFYLILLQEISAQCDFDTLLGKRNVTLGIFSGSTYSEKPKDESCRYICQHCLIHLGDLARYRNQPEEAEGYYKQAVRIEPSSGHPYNQLALLEAARGNKLSTFFFYVRSLALKHPFPPSKTNLEKLLTKQLTYNITLKSHSRPTVDEMLVSFLKLQGHIALCSELDRAEHIAKSLSLNLPSLIVTEALSLKLTIQMLAITMYAVDKVQLESKKKSLHLAVELAGSILNACLVPVYSLQGDQLINYEFLPVIRLVFDWFYIHPDILRIPVIFHRHQLWSAAAKLLNGIQSGTGSLTEEDDGRPLPEDLSLQEFLPLRITIPSENDQKSIGKYNKQQMSRIRAVRIIERGKWLADQLSSGVNCLMMTARPSSESPAYFFESVQSSSPVELPSSPPSDASLATTATPKDIKILTRKPRNVVLAAILKKNSDELQPMAAANSQDSNKQVKFQVSDPVPPPSLALPPPPPPPSSSSFNQMFPSYPHPLPPRLERLQTELRERDQLNQMGLYTNFNISIPPPPVPMVGPSTAVPPPVPPPGLGFPCPPRADQIPTPWSLNTLPPSNHFGSNAYSLFNSQTWHPGPGMPSGLLPDLMEGLPTADRRIIGGPNPMVPPSLWSGPGPSPLERLLEQQKALRGGNSPTKNSKAEF